MNKAQKAYIDEWFVDENGDSRGYSIQVSKYDLTGFARDFLEIDSTPDPETYCLWVIPPDSEGRPLLGITGISKKEAEELLLHQFQQINSKAIVEYKRKESMVTDTQRYEIRKE